MHGNFELKPTYIYRISFTGPILSQIGTQMIYSEMEKLKPFDKEDDVEDDNADDGVVRLTEKTFESYISENPGKF